MSASETLEAPPPPARRRRRMRLLLAILLALAVVATAYILILLHLADKELQEAIALADRLDPGWRLEELEAKRAKIPDEENSARVVMAAAGLLPKPWPGWGPTLGNLVLSQGPVTLAPTSPFNERQTQDLQTALAMAQPALTEARKLIDLPDGRYPYSSTPDGGITTNSPTVGLLHTIPILLYFDVLLRAQQGDADGALASCRAMLNVGRSAGDDPYFHLQLARLAIRSSCCAKIERVLAQVQPSEAALAATQGLLQREEAVPLFLIGARSQRAGWHRMLESLHEKQLPGIGNGLKGTFFSTATFNSRPTLLSLNTRIVEIAKLPVEQQLQRLKEEGLFTRQRIMDYPLMAREWLVPRIEKVTTDFAKGQARTQAELRCAIAALAAERYRRTEGNWPSSLDALVPVYLANVPADPFDGQPLRLRRLETGAVIYSVGPDGQDNDGKLNRALPESPGTDLGFELWDEPHRRQPPKP